MDRAEQGVASRVVLTERARQWGFEQVGFRDRSVSAVAGELGVAWHTIKTQVSVREKSLVDDPERLAGLRAIGVDTKPPYYRPPATTRRSTPPASPTCPPGRTARLLDVTKGRSGTVLSQWLELARHEGQAMRIASTARATSRNMYKLSVCARPPSYRTPLA